MKSEISQERLLSFLDLYEKHYGIQLSEPDGQETITALLGLLEAVQEGGYKRRFNNTALVTDNKKTDE